MAKKKKKPKVRQFKEGDIVQNIADDTFLVRVTQDADPSRESFHGETIAGKYREVGEHDMFWLKSRFELYKKQRNEI